MDATKIVVLILCLLAFGSLVLAEMNSRRNTRAMKEQSEQANKDAK